jgi:hypothetical protein
VAVGEQFFDQCLVLACNLGTKRSKVAALIELACMNVKLLDLILGLFIVF